MTAHLTVADGCVFFRATILGGILSIYYYGKPLVITMGNPLEPFSERVDVRAQNDCELIAKSTKRIQLLFQSKNLTWPEIQKFIKLPGLCSREAACSKGIHTR